MDIFKGTPFLKSNQIGTYTTADNEDVDISFIALLKIMKDLPDPPKAFKAGIVPSGFLPKNTIMISSDIAEKIDLLTKQASSTQDH